MIIALFMRRCFNLSFFKYVVLVNDRIVFGCNDYYPAACVRDSIDRMFHTFSLSDFKVVLKEVI